MSLVKEEKLKEGYKNDEEKPKYHLIPVYPLNEIAKVFTFGAFKYCERNWEKGMLYSRLFSAMNRHLWAWWGGEEKDKESGVHHLIAVCFNAMSIIELQHRGKVEYDDRPYDELGNFIFKYKDK